MFIRCIHYLVMKISSPFCVYSFYKINYKLKHYAKKVNWWSSACFINLKVKCDLLHRKNKHDLLRQKLFFAMQEVTESLFSLHEGEV